MVEPPGFLSAEHLVWLPSGSPLAFQIVAFSDPEFIDFASRPHCCHQPAGALAPSRPGFGGLRIAKLRQYARIFPTWLSINQPGIGLTHNIHAAIENSQAPLEFVPFRPDPGRQYRSYLLMKQPEIIQRHQFQLELVRRHVAHRLSHRFAIHYRAPTTKQNTQRLQWQLKITKFQRAIHNKRNRDRRIGRFQTIRRIKAPINRSNDVSPRDRPGQQRPSFYELSQPVAKGPELHGTGPRAKLEIGRSVW